MLSVNLKSRKFLQTGVRQVSCKRPPKGASGTGSLALGDEFVLALQLDECCVHFRQLLLQLADRLLLQLELTDFRSLRINFLSHLRVLLLDFVQQHRREFVIADPRRFRDGLREWVCEPGGKRLIQ